MLRTQAMCRFAAELKKEKFLEDNFSSLLELFAFHFYSIDIRCFFLKFKNVKQV